MAFIGATNWNQLYNQGSTGNTTGSTGTGFIGGGLAGVGSVLGGQSGNTTSGLAGVGSVLGGVTGANPTSSGSSGLLGGAANIVTGGTSGVLPGAPTGTGFIGGLGTTVLGGGYGSIPRPVRPVRPGRPGRPFIGGINTIRPSRQTVPYHTHTMEHNGWTKETGGPTNMRREKIVYNTPRPPFFGGYGRPTLPQGPPIQPRPVTTIKPGMNIPAVPQAPIMRNASGCGAGYSNASGGDNCSLWMCATGH